MNSSLSLQGEAAQGYASPPGGANPGASDVTLEVRGIGPEAFQLRWKDLQSLPLCRIGPLPIVCYTGRPVRASRIYEGWLLRSLLEHYGLGAVECMRLKQSLILCHAGDGYRALFTWHELFNTPVGQQALVAPEPDGLLTLVSGADLRAGPRNLQRMTSVEWRELPP